MGCDVSSTGDPHIGHAYEAITADVISRYQRMAGKKVFFQTGSDEHGQKIANTAAALGVQPIDICDKYAGEYLKASLFAHTCTCLLRLRAALEWTFLGVNFSLGCNITPSINRFRFAYNRCGFYFIFKSVLFAGCVECQGTKEGEVSRMVSIGYVTFFRVAVCLRV